MGETMIRKDVLLMNPVNLAFLGDAVYELLVRREVIQGPGKVHDLHRRAVQFVSANAQCDDLMDLETILTEEEKNLIRRARNKSGQGPKNTKPQVYALSTGFEALIGALYLSDDLERIEEIFQHIMNRRKSWTSSESEE